MDKLPMKRWTIPVEELEGDFVITLPQDLLDAAELQIGDTLTWHIDDQGRVTLNKKDADGKD
jgi:antitoxin component of MazEF toxin-antitoxin module